jgi:hypothetical protein
MRTWMLLAALALVFAGCPEKKGTEPTKTEPTKVEPTKTEPVKVEPKKEEAKKEEAKKEEKKEEGKKVEAKTATAGNAEENCGALYDLMTKMIEAMTKKLGKGPGPGKGMPPREKYVAACKELPPEVTRCMNPEVAMKEQAACKDAMMKADPAKMKKFKEAMTAQ